MKCMNCGNEIAPGAASCQFCGAQIQPQQGNGQFQQGGMANPAQQGQGYQQPYGQPQQPYNQMQPQGFPGPQNFGGPQGQYQQPYGIPYQPKAYIYPGGSFGQRLRGDFTMLCSLIGAFFITLFAFIPSWVKFTEDTSAYAAFFGEEARSYGESKSFGLFSSYKQEGLLVLMPTIIKISAVFMIILGLWLIFKYLVVFNIIPGVNLTRLTNVQFNEWYGPILMLIMFIYITCDGCVRMFFQGADISKELSVNYGISWWFSLIGIILLFIRPVVCTAKRINFYTGMRR